MTDEHERSTIARYDGLLASIGLRAEEIGPRPLASHWPHVGTSYRGLVIVGQALQGWDRAVKGARWQPFHATTPAGRSEIIQLTRTWHADYVEPIAPIVELNNRRGSPFWQLCADLVALMEPDGPDPWYSRFAWANVYPVGADFTPTERASSPWGPLKAAQDEHVGDLLTDTMRMINARRVVVVSGPAYWWQPAQGAFSALRGLSPPLISAGRFDGRDWVVGYHPGGARRRGFGAKQYASLIHETLLGIGQGGP